MTRYPDGDRTVVVCDGDHPGDASTRAVLTGPHFFLPVGWDTLPILGELCPDCMQREFGEKYGR